MKKRVLVLLVMVLSSIWMTPSLRVTHAACRNPNIAEGDKPLLRLVADSRFVEIEWFGHSFFQITSSKGTQIITDPFRYLGFPMPEVWPDLVTVGKETRNHSNVALANGDPLVLRGLKEWGLEWNVINTFFRDVLIYNVPVHTRSPHALRKGSGFVFEVDGLCIFHTGDAGESFNEDQLDLIGHVDILLVPIGGSYTMGPAHAKTVIEQLKPKIVIPMHYYNDSFVLDRFIDGPYKVRFLETGHFSVSKDTLPPVTEIFVPKVVWHGRDDDDP